jgi:hypothetical protein
MSWHLLSDCCKYLCINMTDFISELPKKWVHSHQRCLWNSYSKQQSPEEWEAWTQILRQTGIHWATQVFIVTFPPSLACWSSAWNRAVTHEMHTVTASIQQTHPLALSFSWPIEDNFFNPETNLRVWGLDLGHNILASIKNHQYLSVQIEYDCETTWY